VTKFQKKILIQPETQNQLILYTNYGLYLTLITKWWKFNLN